MAGPEADDSDGVLVVATTLVVPPEEHRQLESLLAPDERLRAERMVAGVRERFVVGRARLRLVLGRLLETPPEELEFRSGRWGKPDLACAAPRPLHFNLTHSGNRGLVALCRGQPVGIDLEFHTTAFTPEWAARMAASILAADERAAWRLLAEPDRPRALLDTWVVKEAVFKALGCGLAGGLTRLSLPCDRRRLRETLAGASPIQLSATPGGAEPATTLSARLIDVGGDAHAALATIGPPTRLTFSSFEDFMAGGGGEPAADA